MTNQAKTSPLLSVQGLKTFFDTDSGVVRAVDGVSLEIKQGETFALVGESGCGKSVTALSVIRLIPSVTGRLADGSVTLKGHDLMTLSERQMRAIRGKRIAMIFQDPMTSLNPVHTVKQQIREVLVRHARISADEANSQVLELLNAVGLPDPEQRSKEYPHQLSGGMKQRVMIAIALAGDPDLLIADEPTTALDVTIQAQVLSLLRELQRKKGMSIFLITHDLGVVAEMADHVAVMYAGHIIEEASAEAFFKDPKHPYSKKLFASIPSQMKRDKALEIIKGSVPSLNQPFTNCRFSTRCESAMDICLERPPDMITIAPNHTVRCFLYDEKCRSFPRPDSAPIVSSVTEPVPSDSTILQIQNLKTHFPIQKGLFKKIVGYVKAVDGVSLTINKGETLALVGESGCGKTTVAKSILQLIPSTSGSIFFDKSDLANLDAKSLRSRRSQLQIIFQDSYSAMNPRMTVKEIIAEGMISLLPSMSAAERESRIDQLLEKVGLEGDHKKRYPHEFSGGQRQRICIARALAVNPQLIVCDEPTSSLDVSIQAQILNLLKNLQRDLGISYLFVTHNISVVEYLAHNVAVMYLGRIVEYGTVREVLETPKHPYTKALLSAVPKLDPKTKRKIIRLEGDLPSPINPPKGCHFHPRCPSAQASCGESYPAPNQLGNTHVVCCPFVE